MTIDDLSEIKKQAELEVREELFRKRVEAYKTKIRNRRTVWDRVFPWKIIIVKKEKP